MINIYGTFQFIIKNLTLMRKFHFLMHSGLVNDVYKNTVVGKSKIQGSNTIPVDVDILSLEKLFVTLNWGLCYWVNVKCEF